MQKRMRTILLILADYVIINLSYYLAFAIRFDNNTPIPNNFIQNYSSHWLALVAIKIAIFFFFELYSSLWRYASIEELFQIFTGTAVANAVSVTYLVIFQAYLPRSIYILAFMLDLMLIGGLRFSYRFLRRIKNNTGLPLPREKVCKKRVMIIGAGDAGSIIIKELKNHSELESIPVAIIDADSSKHGRRINGVPIVGEKNDIVKVAAKSKIDEIIIAIPSATRRQIKEIVEECKKTRCKLKILPGVYELIDGSVTVNEVREVQIEDLLGRDEVKLNMDAIGSYLKNKVVLVTGGGGSIGSELCRQITKFKPKELHIVDIYENNAYELEHELRKKYKKLDLHVHIASVRDRQRIQELFGLIQPNVVFHAAAHKHVPLMEANPKEAVKNNIIGTYNVATAADLVSANRFVLISTDKAVNPTNVMGATKRVCEMIIQAMNQRSNTEYVAVRFGNVLGSNGSVIPLFKKQIAAGGPVTVTHKDIIRYFMTIPEAAQLVLQAGAMAKGGEIFVLDMGEPVKILTLAEDLIRLSGFEPYEDILINITGLRPGEKLYEELLMDEEGIQSTAHEKIFIGKPLNINGDRLFETIHDLEQAVQVQTDEGIILKLKEMLPTYSTEIKKHNMAAREIAAAAE